MNRSFGYAIAFLLFFMYQTVAAGNLDVDFEKDHVSLSFKNITVTSLKIDKEKDAIILYTAEKVKKDYTVIDYGVLHHVEMINNTITVFLRKRVNYTFSNGTLFLYPYYPQKGVIKSRIAAVRSKASEKSTLETEVLIGTEVIALKESKGWLYIQIPEQNDYKGWIQADLVNVFAEKEMQSGYDRVIAGKWETFTPDTGSPYDLSAGTNYKLIKEEQSRQYIELKNGDRGWIGKLFTQENLSSLREKVVATTRQFLGTPYVWGGTSSQGIDCSGLTFTVFKIHNISLPRNSTPQFDVSQSIDRSQLKPGDLVFFQTIAKGPSHVGIYIGNNKFIHAGLQGVAIADLNEPYFAQRYYGSRRVIKD